MKNVGKQLTSARSSGLTSTDDTALSLAIHGGIAMKQRREGVSECSLYERFKTRALLYRAGAPDSFIQ